jgi:hypothetical protein
MVLGQILLKVIVLKFKKCKNKQPECMATVVQHTAECMTTVVQHTANKS